jgi:hypothetical protein
MASPAPRRHRGGITTIITTTTTTVMAGACIADARRDTK